MTLKCCTPWIPQHRAGSPHVHDSRSRPRVSQGRSCSHHSSASSAVALGTNDPHWQGLVLIAADRVPGHHLPSRHVCPLFPAWVTQRQSYEGEPCFPSMGITWLRHGHEICKAVWSTTYQQAISLPKTPCLPRSTYSHHINIQSVCTSLVSMGLVSV